MPTIQGLKLILLTFAISLGIFMNVLDTSIANVSIPSIAGNMAVSANEGTWVITSFTVSMAIVLPLTGWLAKRFGEVYLFLASTALFTVLSLLCGLANSLPMLVFFRVLQGIAAGPMIPLSQSLLLANYPSDKKSLATALWATVAVAAPVIGPIVGGYITDNYSWPWIFYINLPVGILSIYITWSILRNRETEIEKMPIDYIGLLLLAIGVGCLQILLDKGKDLDWFESPFINTLGIISIISLSFFIVWEITEKYPIVDLTLFKRRNFTLGTIAISLGYMTFFGSIVILPIWLQTHMNYTPTWAGFATAPIGIIPIFLSPLMAKLMNKFDLRMIITFGFIIFAGYCFWLAQFNTQISIEGISSVRFIQGAGMPCFFIPMITLLLSGLPANRIASASGLSNFLRILAGSFGTSISITLWDYREAIHQHSMVERLTKYDPNFIKTIQNLEAAGFTQNASYPMLMKQVINQAYMLATNDIFWISGIIFISLTIVIWFTKPPFLIKSDTSIAH